MPRERARVFSREFKEAAVQRILAGERVQALAEEFQVWPKVLYKWRHSYEWGGAAALLPSGRPTKAVALALGRPVSTPTTSAGGSRRRVRGKAGEAKVPEHTRDAERIAELERKVGQQALELDFFARALRHVKAPPPPSGGTGATASSPSSKR